MPEKFTAEKLVPMAGYRNGMTDFYHRLEAAEILEIVNSRLGDFEEFSRHIRKIIQEPGRFGFPAINSNA